MCGRKIPEKRSAAAMLRRGLGAEPPVKESRQLAACWLRVRKRLPKGAFSVPGAVADQSVITGGYRVFFGDNELVHCQKIDILIGVFTN